MVLTFLTVIFFFDRRVKYKTGFGIPLSHFVRVWVFRITFTTCRGRAWIVPQIKIVLLA